MIIRLCAFLAIVLLASPSVRAQSSSGELSREQLERELDAYRLILLDWGGLTRYGSENSELKPEPNRVVFLGDEITENWGTGAQKFFPGKPYLNRGITRQTTAQMLVRFRQDVIALEPRVVVIQAGTNDIASVMGPSTEATMADNFQSMAELAKLHGIRVVLASVTPVCDCGEKKVTARRSVGKILGVNRWLKEYASKVGATYLDYYSALAAGRFLGKEYSLDGFLLNDTAYARMAPLAERAIADALAGQ